MTRVRVSVRFLLASWLRPSSFARRSVLVVCRHALPGRENQNAPGSWHLHKHSSPATLEMQAYMQLRHVKHA